MPKRSAMLVLLACATAAGLLPLAKDAAAASELVRGRFAYTYEHAEYPSAAAACSALLRTMTPPERLKAAGSPDEYGNVRCQGTQPNGEPGFDQYANAVSYELLCPANSHEHGSSEKSRQDPVRCECDTGLVAKGGATCSEPQEVAGQSISPQTPATNAASAPQNREPEGCGLSKEKQQAIAKVLGKRFSTVPQFNTAWLAAVRAEDAEAVAKLKPDPTKNAANRKLYFNGTRERFWKNVWDDNNKGSALELLLKAGATIPKRGNAAYLEINGKVQGLDVDHVVGLAEDPTQMISVGNMQLSPARENRRSLEDIARLDPFYDPEEWLRKQAAACPVKPKKAK